MSRDDFVPGGLRDRGRSPELAAPLRVALRRRAVDHEALARAVGLPDPVCPRCRRWDCECPDVRG